MVICAISARNALEKENPGEMLMCVVLMAALFVLYVFGVVPVHERDVKILLIREMKNRAIEKEYAEYIHSPKKKQGEFVWSDNVLGQIIEGNTK